MQLLGNLKNGLLGGILWRFMTLWTRVNRNTVFQEVVMITEPRLSEMSKNVKKSSWRTLTNFECFRIRSHNSVFSTKTRQGFFRGKSLTDFCRKYPGGMAEFESFFEFKKYQSQINFN